LQAVPASIIMRIISEHLTRVLIVESDPGARAALAKLLGLDPSVRVVGQAATGQAATAEAARLRPAVILLDLSLPDMPGLSAARAIAAAHPGPRFVLLRAATDPEPTDLPPALAPPLVKPVHHQRLVEALQRAGRLL
jgi:two-component system response regulator AlgR